MGFDIKKEYNFLNEIEINYLNSITNSFIIHNSRIYNQTSPDTKKLTNYINNIKNYIKTKYNNRYYIAHPVEVNRISESDINMDLYHNDGCDLTFVTYFNTNFQGGEFEYLNYRNEYETIEPEVNLTLIMHRQNLHRVKPVLKGNRFSLVCFCNLNARNYSKYKKSII